MLTKDEMIQELKTRNLSEVARNVDVTRVYLSRIAGGKHPHISWEMVKKISDYLVTTKRVGA